MWQINESSPFEVEGQSENYSILDCTYFNDAHRPTVHKISIKNFQNQSLSFNVCSTRKSINLVIKRIAAKLLEMHLPALTITKHDNQTISFDVSLQTEALTLRSIIESLDNRDTFYEFQQVVTRLHQFVKIDRNVVQKTMELQQLAVNAEFSSKAENTMNPMVFSSARSSELALREAYNFPAPYYQGNYTDRSEISPNNQADDTDDAQMQLALFLSAIARPPSTRPVTLTPPPSLQLPDSLTPPPLPSLLNSMTPTPSSTIMPLIEPTPPLHSPLTLPRAFTPAASSVRHFPAVRFMIPPASIVRHRIEESDNDTDNDEDMHNVLEMQVNNVSQRSSGTIMRALFTSDEEQDDENEDEIEVSDYEDEESQIQTHPASSNNNQPNRYDFIENNVHYGLRSTLERMFSERLDCGDIFTADGEYYLSVELNEALKAAKQGEFRSMYGRASLCFDLIVTLKALGGDSIYYNNNYLQRTKIAGYGMRNIVALIWHSIIMANRNNNFCKGASFNDALAALIHGIANGVRGNNRNYNDESDDLDLEDKPACDVGKYNNLISSMLGILPEVQIYYNYLDLLNYELKKELYSILLQHEFSLAAEIIGFWSAPTEPTDENIRSSASFVIYKSFVEQAKQILPNMLPHFLQQNFAHDPELMNKINSEIKAHDKMTQETTGISFIESITLTTSDLFTLWSERTLGRDVNNSASTGAQNAAMEQIGDSDEDIELGLPRAASNSSRGSKRARHNYN